MATETGRLHPGIIVAIAALLIFLVVLIVSVFIRGFHLGPGQVSGLGGVFIRSGLSVSDTSIAGAASIQQGRGNILDSNTTVLSHFLGQSQEVLSRPPMAVTNYGSRL